MAVVREIWNRHCRNVLFTVIIVVFIVTRLGTRRSGFESRESREIFSFQRLSNRAFPPPSAIQWLPCFFPKAKRPGLELDRPPPSNTEDKNEWSHTSTFPVCILCVKRDFTACDFACTTVLNFKIVGNPSRCANITICYLMSIVHNSVVQS